MVILDHVQCSRSNVQMFNVQNVQVKYISPYKLLLLITAWSLFVFSQIRIVYAGAYSLEVGIRGGGIVTIRDGAYSKFDRTTVVDEFVPALGLKVFL